MLIGSSRKRQDEWRICIRAGCVCHACNGRAAIALARISSSCVHNSFDACEHRAAIFRSLTQSSTLVLIGPAMKQQLQPRRVAEYLSDASIGLCARPHPFSKAPHNTTDMQLRVDPLDNTVTYLRTLAPQQCAGRLCIQRRSCHDNQTLVGCSELTAPVGTGRPGTLQVMEVPCTRAA